MVSSSCPIRSWRRRLSAHAEIRVQPAPASRLTRHARFGVLTIPVSRLLRKSGDTTVTPENFSRCREEPRTPRENLVNSNFGEVAEWSKAHASKACVPIGYRGFESHPLR